MSDLRQGFDERLLAELKRVVAIEKERAPSSVTVVADHRSTWRRRLGVAGVALGAAVAIVVVAPTGGGPHGTSQAYAVTNSAGGMITVEIWSIEDPAGLEQQLEAHGIPAAVHYTPPGKLCDPRIWDLSEPPVTIEQRWASLRSQVAIDQTDDGAFRFTLDSGALPEARTLLVYSQYAPPEHGQAADLVASIAVEWVAGNVDRCQLVDGSVQGWPFQEAAP